MCWQQKVRVITDSPVKKQDTTIVSNIPVHDGPVTSKRQSTSLVTQPTATSTTESDTRRA